MSDVNRAPEPSPNPTNSNPTPATPEPAPRRSLLNENPVDPVVDLKPEPKAGDEPKEGDKKPVSGAPDKYSDFKAPDGYELDPKTLETALPLFKELGLSQESAQKLVDFYGKSALSTSEAPYKQWADTQDEWVKSIKTEHGSNLEAKRADIGRAIKLLGPELETKFRDAMEFTGAGNNPAFFNAMSKWASMLGEGSSVRGNGPSDGSPPGQKPSVAQALYPNLPSAAKG